MSKQSGFLKKQKELQNGYMRSSELITKQFMADTFQIALHRLGWGYDRILRLMNEWEEVRSEYRTALNPKDAECDGAREHMDRELKDIVKGKQEFYTFKERYPELKETRY